MPADTPETRRDRILIPGSSLRWRGLTGAARRPRRPGSPTGCAARDSTSCRAETQAAPIVGNRLREIVLDRGSVHLSVRAEMLIYMASRAQLVDEIIGPSLAVGPRGGVGSVPAVEHRLSGLRRRTCRSRTGLAKSGRWRRTDCFPT